MPSLPLLACSDLASLDLTRWPHQSPPLLVIALESGLGAGSVLSQDRADWIPLGSGTLCRHLQGWWAAVDGKTGTGIKARHSEVSDPPVSHPPLCSPTICLHQPTLLDVSEGRWWGMQEWSTGRANPTAQDQFFGAESAWRSVAQMRTGRWSRHWIEHHSSCRTDG